MSPPFVPRERVVVSRVVVVVASLAMIEYLLLMRRDCRCDRVATPRRDRTRCREGVDGYGHRKRGASRIDGGTVMSDLKRTVREGEADMKEAWRKADGDESLGDKAANIGDRVENAV